MGWKDWHLERHCKVNFIWTPGHKGIKGNEKVDTEAKRAAEDGSSTRKDLPSFIWCKTLPTSISATRCYLKREIKNRWNSKWSESPRYQLVLNIDCSIPSNDYIHIIGQLHCNQASLLTQLRTGHAPLNSVLFRIKHADSPDCPHCKNSICKTLLHYLLFCPQYNNKRRVLTTTLHHESSSIPYLLSNRRGIPHLLRYIHNTNCFFNTLSTLQPPTDFIIKNKEPKKRPNTRNASPSLPSNQNAPS